MEFRKPRFVVAVAIMLCAGTANAVVSSPVLPSPVFMGAYTDMYLKQNTFPASLNEQMVFLDSTTATSSVTGHVGSQTGTPLVSFTSTTDTFNAANGFSTITATDGYINNITITAPGYWFDDLIFSVNLGTNANTDLSVTAKDKSGNTDTFANWVAQNNWVNGQNDILVLSTGSNLMQSVTINSQNGILALGACTEATCGIDQLKQIQISGLAPVPEPETYAMLLAGLGLVGFAARRKLS